MRTGDSAGLAVGTYLMHGLGWARVSIADAKGEMLDEQVHATS